MNLFRKLCFLFLLFGSIQGCTSQFAPINFKEILVINYRIDDTDKTQRIKIESYVKITGNGACRKVIDMTSANGVPYYNDTTIKISFDVMQKLNDVFDGKHKLFSHVIQKEASGEYVPPFKLVYYKDINNQVDGLIVFDNLIDHKFYSVLDSLRRLPFPHALEHGSYLFGTSTDRLIAKYHSSCSYCPVNMTGAPIQAKK